MSFDNGQVTFLLFPGAFSQPNSYQLPGVHACTHNWITLNCPTRVRVMGEEGEMTSYD